MSEQLPTTAYNSRLSRLTDDVYVEALRASNLHPPMHSRHEAKAVIEEEFDELWELIKLNPKKPMIHPSKGYPLSIGQWKAEIREELIQTAAMCVRAVYDLCE
jgi:hypothetical protein